MFGRKLMLMSAVIAALLLCFAGAAWAQHDESPDGGHGIALLNFTAEKTSVVYRERFTVTARTNNRSLDAFPGGQIGAALVNDDGSIAAVIGTAGYRALNRGSSRNSTIRCLIREAAAPPGRYRLRTVIRPADGEWRVATLALADTVPTAIDFEVKRDENVVVVPLIQTRWGQWAPYNDMMVGVIRNRTGCGTTAMAQIMKYYEHPKRGIGQSKSYSTGIGTVVPPLDFEIDYDWDNMLDTYRAGATQQQRDAVATLMYHAAVGFRINSGPEGTNRGTSITRIINAMTTHFGYDKSMQRKNRAHFDDDEWERMIREQLDAGMPVFYYYPGHYYVIDGYDSNGRFHFNWGWGGRRDGWYLSNVDWRTLGGGDADADASVDGQHMIINIKPDEGGVPHSEGRGRNKVTRSATGNEMPAAIDLTVEPGEGKPQKLPRDRNKTLRSTLLLAAALWLSVIVVNRVTEAVD